MQNAPCTPGPSTHDPRDNAIAENFFSNLEAELLDRRCFAFQTEACIAAFSYIEGWDNPVRLHSALGYRSPMAYQEEQMQES
jgi:putative transposase